MMQKSGAGICINPKDALALKNAILELHLDVKKTELMVENGQNAVLNNYQWNSQIPLLAKVYTEALG
jgi:glycosyltransferase involved in cell wall biosynthesis